MKKRIIFALFLIGFAAVLGQVILMRELLVVFYGNELSTGVILANWLIWTSAGAFLLGKPARIWKAKELKFATLQIMLSIILPLSIVGVRESKLLLGASPGEVLGFLPIFLVSFLALAPFCLLSGGLFPLGSEMAQKEGEERAALLGKVYLLEAIGSSVGGLLFNYLLIHLLTPLQTTICLSLCLLLSSFLLSLEGKRFGYQIGSLLLLLLGLILLPQAENLGYLSRRFQWKGFELIKSTDTVYGNLILTRRGDQTSLFENGLLIFTYPDLLTAEESVLFALLEHPSPQKVLLIGGGIGGSLEQVLKDKGINRVVYLELDSKVIQLGREYLPAQEEINLSDPRVEVINADGRLWVKKAKERFDMIIVNLPDPYTAQINRFYSVDFFAEAKRILNPRGMISLTVTSSEQYIGPELSRFLSTIFSSLQYVFPDVVVIPGDLNRFIACKVRGILTYRPEVLVERLKQRGIEAKYVREYYLPFRLSQERIEYLLSHIKGSSRLNRDFYPISYYNDMVLWSTYFSRNFKEVFLFFSRMNLLWIVAPVLALLLFFGSLKRRLRGKAILLAVMSMGFAEIAFEVMIILTFQVFFGYLYYKLGLLITSYMIGLAIGSGLSIHKLRSLRSPFLYFSGIQLLVAIYPILLLSIFTLFSFGGSPSWGSNLLFPLLILGGGLLGGFQFPLANKLYLESGKKVSKSAGLIYGLDLVGSCLGALLASAFLLPILGIPGTCWALALINFGVFFILLFQI
jgi:spermidine synthase